MTTTFLDVVGTTWGGVSRTLHSYRLKPDEKITSLAQAKTKAGDFSSLDSAKIRTVTTEITTRRRKLS